jgi:hypothetical protein|tara:strand:+ start:3129 stop:3665 length:537 start_codon:yes stop_codon:yes gene_type:complete
MNYNQRNPTFSFRLSHLLNQRLTKMAKLHNETTNEHARSILSKYLQGNLVEKKLDDKQERILELRIKKMEMEIKYAELKNKYLETFNAPMSRRAEIAIKPQIIVEQKQVFQNPQSPYDASNRRLQCTDCGSLFCWYSEQEFDSQMQEFQRHLVSKHDRPKTEIERQVLIELNYEGDSR